MKKTYVIGTNVSTSLSPAIFNYWFKKYNINCEYDYIEIEEENFEQKIKKTLNEDFVGLNITIPYKEKILPFLKNIDPIAKKIGAVNCITKKDNLLYGSNTDWAGFSTAMWANNTVWEMSKNWNPLHRVAIIIGYGGAAKSIIYSLKQSGFGSIYVFNRSFEKIWKESIDFGFYPMKLEDLQRAFNCQPIDIVFPPSSNKDLRVSIKNSHTKPINPNLVVNTAPINVLKDMNIKKDRRSIFPKTADWVGYDIVYRPRRGTGFLDYFDSLKSIEGINMLVHQAALCFKFWFGYSPETDDEELFKNLYIKLEEQK